MYGLIIGTPVSLAWIILMRLIASVMVWLSMVCLIVLSGYFTYVSYYKYKYYSKTNVIELDKLEDDKLDSLLGTDFIDLINIQLNSIRSNTRVWLALIIISGLILVNLVFVLIVFIALRQRVRVAIVLIKESNK